MASDEDFEKYLEENNLELGTMITPALEITDDNEDNSQTKNDNLISSKESPLPRRSTKPVDLSNTKHCVGYNMVMVSSFVCLRNTKV